MRLFFKILFFALLLSPFLLAAGVWFALDDRPLLTSRAQLTHADIARAQALLREQDPRALPSSGRRVVRLDENDISLAGSYLVQRFADGSARVRIRPGVLDFSATLHFARLPLRRFLNIRGMLTDDAGRPRLEALRIGAVPVPSPLAQWLLETGYRELYKVDEFRLVDDLVQDFQLQHRQLEVRYAWDGQLLSQARGTLLGAVAPAALEAYHARLLALQAQGIGRKGSLVNLLAPLFDYARERSANADAVVENKALLVVLGAWASKRGLAQLVPDASARPASFRLTLERRRDFGQHFLTSAALSARGDGSLADAVGLFKEMQDAESGSGFSFTDIAADRAGARFGQLAVASQAGARRLQARLAAGVLETDIMPRAADLPEHLSAAEFKKRFGRVGSPAYEQLMAVIEDRIAACSLYRD